MIFFTIIIKRLSQSLKSIYNGIIKHENHFIILYDSQKII